jgi:8-oxo-dGTP pyrophosphatase MutT (NUDIX family)
MSKFTRKWFKCSDGVLEEHSDIEIRQRYCFIITKDRKIIIVSKDKKSWQFSGGHPKSNESWQITLQREVWEETGIDFSNVIGNIIKLGYYLITFPNERFLQERYLLVLDKKSGSLSLEPHEDINDNTEVVKFVKAVNISQIGEYIPWVLDAEGWNVAVKYYSSNTYT